jgi:flagellar biosynthesis protein FlhG
MAEKKRKKKKQIFVVLSGKGGTGKTFVTANLAAALAEQGRKVLLIDANFASPNLHTFFHKFTLGNELLSHISEKENDAGLPVEQTDVANLLLIPGNRYLSIDELKKLTRIDFIDIVKSQEAEFVFIDMCPGWGRQILETVSRLDKTIFVIEPTPFAVESFFSLMKRTLSAKIAHTFGVEKSLKITEVILSPSKQELKDMHDILSFYLEEDIQIHNKLKNILKKYKPSLIINKTHSLDDKEIGSTITFLVK